MDLAESLRARESVQAAVKALARLARRGGWTGFPTLAGRSNVWVEAFVVAHIGRLGIRRTAIQSARARLRGAQSPDGGWSYGRDVPADADSTAWALAALPALAPDARNAARSFLRAHRQGPGFATYTAQSGIGAFIGAGERSIEGWLAPHPDVTAAVIAADPGVLDAVELQTTLAWLQSRQTGAGVIESYWWRGPFYASALTLRAFARARRSLDPRTAARLSDALRREHLPGGGFALGSSMDLDPFTTALALECLCRLPADGLDDIRDAAADALIAAQDADGSWSGDFTMRIPAPDVLDPALVPAWHRGTGGGNSFVHDSDGLFATSLAAYALDLWAARRREGPSRVARRSVPLPQIRSFEAEVTVPVAARR